MESDAKEEEFPVGTFTESAPTMPGGGLGGINIPSMGALSGMLKQLGPEQKKKLTEVAKTLMKQQVRYNAAAHFSAELDSVNRS